MTSFKLDLLEASINLNTGITYTYYLAFKNRFVYFYIGKYNRSEQIYKLV